MAAILSCDLAVVKVPPTLQLEIPTPGGALFAYEFEKSDFRGVMERTIDLTYQHSIQFPAYWPTSFYHTDVMS